jgi:DNA-binding NarL/FixJ family response regulator
LKFRDIAILELVEKGYNNAEIGESMCLSPETVKKYLYLIFRELDVKNRGKAVIKAKELGFMG